MRKFTFWLTLFLIFTIPWEDALSIPAIGSFTKLLGLVVAGFWFLTILSEGRFRKPHLFHAFVLLFFLWNIVSYIWSTNINDTIGRIITYGQIFILMIIVWEMFQKPAEIIVGLQAYIFGAFVPIASSINNYLHGTVAENYEVRYSATGVNAVDLVVFLLLGLPIAWHLYTHSNKKKNRILKIVNISYLPLAIITVLLTASRTSLFAIVPAVIYILWPKKVDIVQLGLRFMILVVSILVSLAFLPSSVIERLASASTSISSGDIGGRVTLWRETIASFTQHPIIGSGSGTLNTIIGGLSHQTFLSVLAETGLIGFVLFIFILAIVINQAVRLPKGYSGLWLSSFFVWFIGVLSLSFEFRKVTWLFFSFVIIEGAALHKKYRSKKLKSRANNNIKSQSLTSVAESSD
jgi:O-antigen ligase